MTGDPPGDHKEDSACKEPEKGFVSLSEKEERKEGPEHDSDCQRLKNHLGDLLKKVFKHDHFAFLSGAAGANCCSTF